MAFSHSRSLSAADDALTEVYYGGKYQTITHLFREEDGTYSCRLHNGRFVENLPRYLFRVGYFPVISPGDRVRAIPPGSVWRQGRVTAPAFEKGDQLTLLVEFDDGEVLPVPVSNCQLLGTFQVGDRVELRLNGSGVWYPGTIDRVNPSGTYSVVMDENDMYEPQAHAGLLIPLQPPPVDPHTDS
jgi:hypothetical protein